MLDDLWIWRAVICCLPHIILRIVLQPCSRAGMKTGIECSLGQIEALQPREVPHAADVLPPRQGQRLQVIVL